MEFPELRKNGEISKRDQEKSISNSIRNFQNSFLQANILAEHILEEFIDLKLQFLYRISKGKTMSLKLPGRKIIQKVCHKFPCLELDFCSQNVRVNFNKQLTNLGISGGVFKKDRSEFPCLVFLEWFIGDSQKDKTDHLQSVWSIRLICTEYFSNNIKQFPSPLGYF